MTEDELKSDLRRVRAGSVDAEADIIQAFRSLSGFRMVSAKPVGWLYTLRGAKSFSPTQLPHCIALGWHETALFDRPNSVDNPAGARAESESRGSVAQECGTVPAAANRANTDNCSPEGE